MRTEFRWGYIWLGKADVLAITHFPVPLHLLKKKSPERPWIEPSLRGERRRESLRP
jgi:hypothetical protein